MTDQQLHIRLIGTTAEFSKLHSGWNELLRQSGQPNIFLTWEWIFPWWKVFQGGKKLLILLFYHEKQLIGIAPLYLRIRKTKGILPLRELLFLGSGETVRSEYLDLIYLPGWGEKCFLSLHNYMAGHKLWDIAFFKDINEDSPLLLFPFSPPLQSQRRREEICYHITPPPTFENYLAGLDPRMRRNIRNRRRNLQRDFSVEYCRLENSSELSAWQTEFIRLHNLRREQKGEEGKFKDPLYGRFHSLIMEEFRKQGWLFARALKLNEVTVATRYNFLYANKIYDYQTGYDPGYSRQGVMQALISYILEECIERKIREFDFLAGDDDYKRRFATGERKIFSLKVFNNTGRGKLCRLPYQLKYQ